MGISFQEFRKAMELYGAVEVFGQVGSRYSIPVPCFYVAGTDFLHSGSYYIVQQGIKVPEEVMNKAMAELGEEYPGGNNFWYGEIHSVRGILTLAAMLEGKYDKERIKQLTSETYKQLLSCSLIQGNAKLPFKKAAIRQNWKELYRLVIEHDNIVNPFARNTALLKEPIEYLDKINVSLSFDEKNNVVNTARLDLEKNASSTSTRFIENAECWSYYTHNGNEEEKSYTSIVHYYNNGSDGRAIDEVIYLGYVTGDGYNNPNNIDLRISLITGLAWRTYRENQAVPVTDKQLEVMITHLKRSIEKTKRRIIDEMIVER